MALELVKSENFGAVQADIYSDGDSVFMTIDQLARCLEYADKSGVEKIVQRNEYLKKVEFSGTVGLSVPNGKGFSEQQTRLFTEDGIYEVTMLSKQPKAREFRAWIRSVLKEIRKTGEYSNKKPDSYLIENPAERARRWAEEYEEKLALMEKIEEDKPKVQFAEAVLKSEDNIKVGDMERILSNNHLKIGRNKMFEYLRNNKIVDKDNLAYQTYIDQGYFFIKENTYSVPSGKVHLGKTTRITPKGQTWIVNKIREYLNESRQQQ